MSKITSNPILCNDVRLLIHIRMIIHKAFTYPKHQTVGIDFLYRRGFISRFTHTITPTLKHQHYLAFVMTNNATSTPKVLVHYTVMRFVIVTSNIDTTTQSQLPSIDSISSKSVKCLNLSFQTIVDEIQAKSRWSRDILKKPTIFQSFYSSFQSCRLITMIFLLQCQHSFPAFCIGLFWAG